MKILPRAEAFEQSAPRHSGAELPIDSISEKSVAPLAMATDVGGTTRQQTFDARDLMSSNP